MNLLDSRTGRAIRALRRGHIAAEAFGVQTARALELALRANFVGDGSEVVTTAFSYVATPAAIRWSGALPVVADIGSGLVDAGTQRLVVAGGETSGAVVQALDVHTLRIGAAICPGVPWTQAVRGATGGFP